MVNTCKSVTGTHKYGNVHYWMGKLMERRAMLAKQWTQGKFMHDSITGYVYSKKKNLHARLKKYAHIAKPMKWHHNLKGDIWKMCQKVWHD